MKSGDFAYSLVVCKTSGSSGRRRQRPTSPHLDGPAKQSLKSHHKGKIPPGFCFREEEKNCLFHWTNPRPIQSLSCNVCCLPVPSEDTILECLITPIYKGPRSKKLPPKRLLWKKLWKDIGLRICDFGSEIVINNCVDYCVSFWILQMLKLYLVR